MPSAHLRLAVLLILAAASCSLVAALSPHPRVRGRVGDAGPSLVIKNCHLPASPDAQYQQWTFGPYNEIILAATGACIDVENYDTTDGATVYTWTPCHPEDKDPTHQNEAWTLNANGTISEISSGMVLDRQNYGTTPGTSVWLYHATGAANQKWAYNATDKTIRATDSGLCLDGGTVDPRACDMAPLQGSPLCNPALPTETRANWIVSQLQTPEKVCLLTNGACGVPRLNIPAYQWWSEALHGVGGSPGVHFGGPVPNATSFPQVCLTASSFNRTLFHTIGSTISTEARAMNNVGRAGLTFWAPNINIFRDPRWGRGQETPGEDPYLTSEYAKNFVPGMQEGEDMTRLKVSSCCKHYFDYNLENWHGVDRYHFNAITTDQDLADTYLPAFEACVVEGKASSLMCSYNAVNGVPSCANGDFMQVVARQAWGFQGYITSDCGAVDNVYGAHHYTKTPADTCEVTLASGMDIECGGFLQNHLADAIASQVVTMDVVNASLVNLFVVQLRLGIFDPVDSQPYLKYNYTDKVDTPEHQQLALEAARQGIVLLKNDNKALPLTGHPNIAVIGPSGDATGTMQGNYAGSAPYLISPLAGLKTYTTAAYTQGCDVACASTSGFAAATQAAAAADVVVVVVGLDQAQESEGHDREILSLPGNQDQLVSAVAQAAKSPIIVVVMSGGPCDISAIKANTKVGAILWVGYPGQSGGQAIADVLFGTYNPGGRLTTTVYPADFINVASMFNVDMRPNATANYPGRSYRFYTGEPVYTFGDGLSYTTFSYSMTARPAAGQAASRVSHDSIASYVANRGQHEYLGSKAPVVQWVDVKVTNTGDVAGSDVVLMFVQSPTPGEGGAPLKTLAGFERVFLEPGQSIDVPFSVTAQHLTLTTLDGGRTTQRGTWKLLAGQPTQTTLAVEVA